MRLHVLLVSSVGTELFLHPCRTWLDAWLDGRVSPCSFTVEDVYFPGPDLARKATVAGTDPRLLPGSVVHVPLAVTPSNSVAQPPRTAIPHGGVPTPCAGKALEMGSGSSRLGERGWNYRPVPWDREAGKGCCQERPSEKRLGTTPDRADGRMEAELSPPMLQADGRCRVLAFPSRRAKRRAGAVPAGLHSARRPSACPHRNRG